MNDIASNETDRAEAQRLREEVAELKRHVDGGEAEVALLIGERDAARAQLAAQGATSTDRLDRGEPFVWVVTPSEDNVDVGAVVSTWDTREEAEDFLRGYDGGEAVVPLYRDRLAREAQAPAPEEDTATVDSSTRWVDEDEAVLRHLILLYGGRSEQDHAALNRLAAAARRAPGADR